MPVCNFLFSDMTLLKVKDSMKAESTCCFRHFLVFPNVSLIAQHKSHGRAVKPV